MITTKPKTFTQIFRELKVGETITMDFSARPMPYTIAKHAGIKVSIESADTQPDDGTVRLKVTRIDPAKKDNAIANRIKSLKLGQSARFPFSDRAKVYYYAKKHGVAIETAPEKITVKRKVEVAK